MDQDTFYFISKRDLREKIMELQRPKMHLCCKLKRFNSSLRKKSRKKLFLFAWTSFELWILVMILFEVYNLVILLLAYLYYIIRFKVPNDLEVRLYNGERFIEHFYFYLNGPRGFQSKQIKNPEDDLG